MNRRMFFKLLPGLSALVASTKMVPKIERVAFIRNRAGNVTCVLRERFIFGRWEEKPRPSYEKVDRAYRHPYEKWISNGG